MKLRIAVNSIKETLNKLNIKLTEKLNKFKLISFCSSNTFSNRMGQFENVLVTYTLHTHLTR